MKGEPTACKHKEEIDTAIERSSTLDFTSSKQALTAGRNFKFASIPERDMAKSLLIITMRVQKKSFLKNVDGLDNLYHTRTVRYIDFHSFTGTGIFFEHIDESSGDKSALLGHEQFDAAGDDTDSQQTDNKPIDRIVEKGNIYTAKQSHEFAADSPLLQETEETHQQRLMTDRSRNLGDSSESRGRRLQTEHDGMQQQQSPIILLKG